MSEQDVNDWIGKQVASNDVVLFMKGTGSFRNADSQARLSRSSTISG